MMTSDDGSGRAERVGSGGVSRGPQARYLPIAEHGLIGDLHTVALVGTDGTIDWYCRPGTLQRLGHRNAAYANQA